MIVDDINGINGNSNLFVFLCNESISQRLIRLNCTLIGRKE